MMDEIQDRYDDVNRNMPGFLVPVGKNHQSWSKEYEKEMQEFLIRNPDASLNEVIQEGQRQTEILERRYSRCVD